MKTKLLYAVKTYPVPILLFLYVIFHLILTQTSHLSPWKLGGYGMYSTYHPNSTVVWLESDDKRYRAKSWSRFKENSDFQEQLKVCRTFPSDHNLSQLQSIIEQSTGSSFKIEIWHPVFDSESQQLSFNLLNSLENTTTE